jgi:hypothetical protein
LLLLTINARARADYQPPAWLPHYDLNVRIDVDHHQVSVRERITWINYHKCPAESIVFNNHSHFTIPKKDIGLLAKTLEILKLAPSEALDFGSPPCQIQAVYLVDPAAQTKKPLTFGYRPDNDTALEVPLPGPVSEGQSVTLELEFTLRLPQRQGRWGQWRGVTFLAQWLPVAAYYDEAGWHPTPFIPWHQPFYNEAGIYSATILTPPDETLGCTGSIASCTIGPGGWKEWHIGAVYARDFAVFCSKHYQEIIGQAGPVKVRCLHLPGHDFYGHEMIRIACEAIPTYTEWFGPFPYPEFTVVESYFGWNGNECGGVVMVDERLFGMPHMARNYVDSLLTHEICHQWWYNAVGTNGYAETWMDEGLATYFCHRMLDRKLGKNNPIIEYPSWASWLPSIHREDFRNFGMYGAVARGEAVPTVGPLPQFKHLINLSSMTYDRGSKIVGMIEERLGPAAFLDFMRCVYRKYYFRVIHVREFQHELEDYTHQSWQEFFDNWLFGAGMSDWSVEKVNIEALGPGPHHRRLLPNWCPDFLCLRKGKQADSPCRVTVLVRQKAEYCEPTVLGFCLDGSDHYQVRLPILPDTPVLELPDQHARMEALSRHLVRVTIELPCEPTQITVDPDQVLIDRHPDNNNWKPVCRWRLTPLYFQLDETDVTNAYDRWNFIAGPWVFADTYTNPWFTRSPMAGFRVGAYRTQEFSGGGFVAYRTNDRNVVAGVDGLWDHWPWCNTQVGFVAERSLATIGNDQTPSSRAVVFGRYVMMYSDSLYLPPFEYVEAFGSIQDRNLPDPRFTTPGTRQFETQTAVGLHYHKNYLTPYWDPEAGIAIDATVEDGLPVFGSHDFRQAFGQVSTVKYTPDPLGLLKDTPWLCWLRDSRWAFRLFGAAATPDDVQFFSLGGGDLFRGFDQRERQGSMVWVGSVEWRVPILRDLRADYCDHVAGLRNVYAVAFYDVGNAYLNGRELGPTAQAIGGSLRFDVLWIGLIERTMLRIDVAKALNTNAPVQFWFGIMHPF